jgi:arylformamidase
VRLRTIAMLVRKRTLCLSNSDEEMTTPTDPAYIEKQYFVRGMIPEHPQIFARWAERSAAARAKLHCELNIRFGVNDSVSEDETLDIFFAHGAPKKFLLFMHGGYWRSLDKSDHSMLAEEFVRHGVSVAFNNYSLAPKVPIAEIVRQARAATAWCARNAARYGLPAQEIYLAGHSAGGHLSAMQLTADWKTLAPDLPPNFIKGAFGVSGLYDLAPLLHVSFNSDLRLTEDQIAPLSPAGMRPRVRAPLYLSVGGAESDEFKRQTRLLAEKWSELGVTEIAMPGFNHLVVIEELANRDSALFKAALRMMGSGA